MSQIVLDAIAADTATLTRLVDVPEEPLGYGRVMRCVTDLFPNLDEVDPFSRLGIAEATVRRLTTRRGTNPDDENYGRDITEYLNRGTTTNELAQMAGEIRLEAEKHDPIERCEVTVRFPGPDSMSVSLRITAVDPAVGTFDLVLAVTSGSVLIEALQ